MWSAKRCPRIYILEGHGEAGLPASFREQLEKENFETGTLSLLTVDAIPEDADCVMIYAPESDISQEELGMNALSSLIGETEAMAIRSKSLNLTISDSAASLLKVTLTGVFPLLYLGAGIWAPASGW